MPSLGRGMMNSAGEEESDLRRGPWTREEDNLLIHYISCHGEGRWNLLAKRAGLKRTGKSCRLRWLNYLKPDIKRGNLTPQEQLLILELHHKWGNRWSKIAQYLPGRTDNEIKNYWRTRVQKQARQLNIESNSKRFLDTVRHFWMPRLLQKMEQSSTCENVMTPDVTMSSLTSLSSSMYSSPSPSPPGKSTMSSNHLEVNCPITSLDRMEVSQPPEFPLEFFSVDANGNTVHNPILLDDMAYFTDIATYDADNLASMSAMGMHDISPSQCHMEGSNWTVDDLSDALWTVDDIWKLRDCEEMGV